MKRRLKVALLGVAGVVTVGVVAVVAQASIIQAFKVSVSPAKAGKSITLKVRETTGLTPDEPGYETPGQPPPQKTQIIRLQKGGKFNGRRFSRCRLARLQARGPRGCPRKSRIGTGTGKGSARPIVTQDVSAKLTLFNGQRKGRRDTIYVFVLPDLGPTFVVVGTIKKIRKGQLGWELRFKIPPIKTLPSAPDAAIIEVKTKTPRKRVTKRIRGKRKRYNLIEAPRRCTRKGWAFQGEFRFVDGRTVKVSGKQRCRRR